jgi:hypothetical protein
MQPAVGRPEFGVDLLDALEDRLACDLRLFLHKPGHGVLERPSSGGCRSDDQSREGVECSKALCSILAASLMRPPVGLTDGGAALAGTWSHGSGSGLENVLAHGREDRRRVVDFRGCCFPRFEWRHGSFFETSRDGRIIEDVAAQLRDTPEPASSTTASATTSTATRPVTNGDGTARTAADGTARTTGTATTTADARKAEGYWYPDHVVYNATKDQLKAMPQFKY